MYKMFLAATAAALAMAPALAGPGGGHGGGGGNGGGGGHGGGHGGGGEQHAMGDHGNGGGGGVRAMDGGGRGHGHGGFREAGRGHVGYGHGGGRREAMRGERGHGQRAMRFEHANRRTHVERQARDVRRSEGFRAKNFNGNRDLGAGRAFAGNGYRDGYANGCPPGLAAKNNGCLPPGQAKKLVGFALPNAYARSMLSGPYADWYRDDNQYLYRLSGDTIYRVDRDTSLINALIPYGGSDFNYYPVGMNYPSDYNYYNVPSQYQSYYPDGGPDQYRYADNAIYSVNPQTSAIQSIAALLAGDLGVGQQLPSGYGVYNLPLAYRDRYPDTADNLYRYNDGYIYRADPRTQLITSVISAIT